MSGLLPMLILLPLLGGGLLLVLSAKPGDDPLVNKSAVWLSGLMLIVSLLMIGGLVVRSNRAATTTATTPVVTQSEEAPPASGSATQAPTQTGSAKITFQPAWFAVHRSSTSKLQLALGMDALGASMVLLTTMVVFVAMLFASQTVHKNFASYAGWMLLAEAGLLIVFLAMDLILFYVGFELALLPLLVLISRWGEGDCKQVAKRFVLFTLSGSIPMVLALIAIAWNYSNETGITVLFDELSKRAQAAAATTTVQDQAWIFWLLVLGLGIKMAVLPFHTWLPSTYRAAHPTTTAVLAAVVLKMGLFGFLRLALPLTPVACFEYGPAVIGTLGAIAVIYGALAALSQTDIRLLLAYSSLSHVGFISLGMFSLTEEGIAGATLQMFNHGITTAAMFLLAGCVFARRGTADIATAGRGMATTFPGLAAFVLFFTFAGAGMPGLNNFVGEVMALSAMMTRYPALSILSAVGILLGAWYALRLARDILFGGATKAEKPKHGSRSLITGDLLPAEWLPIAALAMICIVIGCFPQPAIDFLKPDSRRLADLFSQVESSNMNQVPTVSTVPSEPLSLASQQGPSKP
jgi:NADH-quinone oxidoreductase subunit M